MKKLFFIQQIYITPVFDIDHQINTEVVCFFTSVLSKNQIVTGSFIDEHDGQSYKTVYNGEQYWMAENLNYYTPSGSTYYNNDSRQYAQIYGRLYDWYTAKISCPKGWHLSIHEDWKKLELF